MDKGVYRDEDGHWLMLRGEGIPHHGYCTTFLEAVHEGGDIKWTSISGTYKEVLVIPLEML